MSISSDKAESSGLGLGGYREANLRRGREATILARALELAAEATGSTICAEDAWRATSHHASDLNAWPQVAASAARALGLHPSLSDAVLAAPPRNRPALVRTGPGRWLVALGGRGRRCTVIQLDDQGETRLSVTRRQLASATNGQPWMQLQPLLALDPISAHRSPELAGHPWRRLRAFLRLERRELGVVAVYAVVVGALTLATPIAAQALVNTVAFGAVLQPLVVLTVLLLGGLTFAGLLSVLEAYVVEVLQRRVFLRVADDFGRRLPILEPDALDRSHGPELANRFFEVVTLQKSLAVLLLDGLSLTLQTAIGMFLLGFYHPLLLAFDVVLVILLLVVLLGGRGAVAAGLRESSAKYKTAAWLEDIARAPHLFRGAAARQHAAERTDVLCRDYIAARKSHFRVLLRQLAGGIGLQVVAMVSLLGVGGWLVINRQLTLGQLVAAELVIAAIGVGFMKLGKNLEKLYDLNVGVLKLARVVDLPTERRGGEAMPEGAAARVGLRAATIRRGGRVVVSGVSLDAEAGARIRVTGASGAGASTLLEALAGLRTPAEGSVHIDGLDLRRADLASARNQIALVRGAQFVDGTILDNLRLASTRPLDEPGARALLAIVDLQDTIDDLPEGIDTTLLPDGAPLSESQSRRLALARALATRPRLLLLDRALDRLGLSPSAMRRLLDTIFADDAPWTTVVVTDDAAVAERCDRALPIGAATQEAV